MTRQSILSVAAHRLRLSKESQLIAGSIRHFVG